MARAMRTVPALMGTLSPSKRAVVSRDGVYVMEGRETRFLTWRELDALGALCTEFKAQRAAALDDAVPAA